MHKLLFLLVLQAFMVACNRTFVIDYENNQFLKDGEPFQYISGSIHYFRVPRVYWQDRFDKMVATGLNTIQTYVDWSQHEPLHGQYDFEDNLDIEEFLTLANQTGLTVVLRAGPYIDAEREFGGLPFWLLQKNPKMVIRSSDPTFLKFVDSWMEVLLTKIKPLLYINGGPVITVQVENEYGSYFQCDKNYTAHLRDTFRRILGPDAVLFTTDGDQDQYLQCGVIDDVYAAVDFGPSHSVDAAFQAQRDFSPQGPLINSEFYTGWLDHWGQRHSQSNVPLVREKLIEMLLKNASVNMYMFHGGTSFGFTAGSNLESTFEPCPTSYDYDAPLTEAGDPTRQLDVVRDVIMQFTGVEPPPVPPATPKAAYGNISMTLQGTVFDFLDQLSPNPPVVNTNPLTFEELGQAYGFVLYEKILHRNYPNALLSVENGIHDRGYVFLDEVPVGLFNRMQSIDSVYIFAYANQKLSILIENQGRFAFGNNMTEFKGITQPVRLDGDILQDWNMSSIPLKNVSFIGAKGFTNYLNIPNNMPAFYLGRFVLPENEEPMDTFLNPTRWTKGVAFLNGYNLGRYWPVEGPQITLYVPKSALRSYPDVNELILFEQDGAPNTDVSVKFDDKAIIDAPVIFDENYQM